MRGSQPQREGAPSHWCRQLADGLLVVETRGGHPVASRRREGQVIPTLVRNEGPYMVCPMCAMFRARTNTPATQVLCRF